MLVFYGMLMKAPGKSTKYKIAQVRICSVIGKRVVEMNTPTMQMYLMTNYRIA